MSDSRCVFTHFLPNSYLSVKSCERKGERQTERRRETEREVRKWEKKGKKRICISERVSDRRGRPLSV